MNIIDVDAYLRDGCGRCEHYKTPACKVHRWADVLEELRKLVLASGLEEQVKWGQPCYSLEGKNVVMIAAFKESCALSFFKGAALADEDGLLESPGPNSRFARFLKFRSSKDIKARRKAAERFLQEAIALERAGKRVEPAAAIEEMPEELARRLAGDPALNRAFLALTPGRRRSHVLHISGAKQSATREKRVERCAKEIAAGRGFNERA